MENHNSNAYTAMIIDDNEMDQMLYRRIISRSSRIGKVICYTDAGEALNFLKLEGREEIDIIFLDINMPRMDGFEFLAAVTAQLGDSFSSAVVVMLTTSLAEEDQNRAMQFDIVKAYMNKPLRQDDIDKIADIVHGERQGAFQVDQQQNIGAG